MPYTLHPACSTPQSLRDTACTLPHAPPSPCAHIGSLTRCTTAFTLPPTLPRSLHAYRFFGEEVYYRGIVEFSNVCVNDCGYCGIRKHMSDVKRCAYDWREEACPCHRKIC